MNPRLAMAALGLIAAAALAGCGKQGDLERPRPMFGQPFQPSAEAITRDDAAARARYDGARFAPPRAPQSVEEVRNQGLGGDGDLRAVTPVDQNQPGAPANQAEPSTSEPR